MDVDRTNESLDQIAVTSPVLMNHQSQSQDTRVYIRHYFVFSLFSSICLCPLTGIIALVYSIKSSVKADVKMYNKARLYSRYALLWNLISLLLIVFGILLSMTFCYQMKGSMT